MPGCNNNCLRCPYYKELNGYAYCKKMNLKAKIDPIRNLNYRS